MPVEVEEVPCAALFGGYIRAWPATASNLPDMDGPFSAGLELVPQFFGPYMRDLKSCQDEECAQ